MCTPPIVVIRESGLTIIELELELELDIISYAISLLSNIDSIFTFITRLYTPSSMVTLISNVYVVNSFYFSMFQLHLPVRVSI